MTEEPTLLFSIILTQCVHLYGEENMNTISKILKQHPCLKELKQDFFLPKTCSAHYSKLLNSISQEQSTDMLVAEPLADSAVAKLLKKLNAERIQQLTSSLAEDQEKMLKILQELQEIEAGKYDEAVEKQVVSEEGALVGMKVDEDFIFDVSTNGNNSESEFFGRKRDKIFIKTAMVFWQKLSEHRYGAIFMNPVREEDAPDYYRIIKKPVCLSQIKTRIKDGQIASAAELHHAILLMVANAIMFNGPDSDLTSMANDLQVAAEEHLSNIFYHDSLLKRKTSTNTIANTMDESL